MTERFPTKKDRYCRCVGRLLPHRVGQIIEELLIEAGYKKGEDFIVWVNPKQGNDVDLKVKLHGKYFLVAEILNWSVKSILSEKRKQNIIRNLLSYNCKRILICTVLNETEIEEFERKGIAVIKIGYQLLPRCFYGFFKDKNQTEARRIDSKQTRMDIKSKIAEYLEIPKLTDRLYVIMQMECQRVNVLPRSISSTSKGNQNLHN